MWDMHVWFSVWVLHCNRCRFPSNRRFVNEIVACISRIVFVLHGSIISELKQLRRRRQKHRIKKKAKGLIYFVSKTKVHYNHYTSWYVSLLSWSELSISLKISKDRFVNSDHRNFDFVGSTHKESLVLLLTLLLQVKVCSFCKFLNNLISKSYITV